jgi:flavin reductase (DIM6/NTAB) family NADH-FMN oxidoreductase RutF
MTESDFSDNDRLTAVDADRFRAALRLVPEPVAIVTTVHDGQRHGLTATAFSSVSAEPPQILVCVNQRATSWSLIRDSRRFAVNFLTAAHRPLAEAFAGSSENRIEHFGLAQWTVLASGAPVLVEAIAALDCTVVQHQLVGTHLILVGRVIGVALGSGEALLYRAGGFGQFRAR